MFSKKFSTLLLFSGLVIGFSSCRSAEDQIIDKREFLRVSEICGSSPDCSNQFFLKKVEKYCLDNRLSAGECSELRNKVIARMIEYNIERGMKAVEEIKRLENRK